MCKNIRDEIYKIKNELIQVISIEKAKNSRLLYILFHNLIIKSIVNFKANADF